MIPNKIKNNRVIQNASWLIVSKIVQSLLGLIIGMISARYLGPSNYGLINYAASVVAFVLPIAQLGFNSVLVQEYTNHPDEEGKIMGTTIVGSLCSSFICIAGVVCFTLIANPGENITTLVCWLYSLMLFFQAFELIVYWFQSKLLSKYTAIVSFIAYLIVSGYKIFLLVSEKSVEWFAISYSIDYFLIAISLFIIYKKLGGQRISCSFSIFKRIFFASKYYIISGLMVTIFGQTDKIMLKLMLGDSVTGYYSAAITVASLSSFVFTAIIDSFRPSIFQHKKDGDVEAYEKSLLKLYSVITYLALAQSIVMTIFSGLIINILYGNDYAPSAIVLQVIVWYSTFSYLGGAKDVWILAEGKQKYLILLNGTGALINVVLNYILINQWGAIGAAIASIITQAFTNIIMPIIIKPLRHNVMLMIKSLNPKVLIGVLK